jgi:PAS domain S-box-containing protein
MRDSQKNREQLIKELRETRRQLAALAASEAERRQAEGKLRESEEKFSKAFHASPDIISIATLKDGRIIEVNDSSITTTGFSREEVIGRSTTELNMWVDPAVRERIAQVLEKEGRVRNIELEFRKKSGETHWVLYSAELINIGGEPCILGVSTDITRRKQAEMELVSAQEKLKEAHRLAHIGTWDLILESDTVTWSEELYSIVGWDPSHKIIHTAELPGLYTLDSWNRLNQAIEKALATGEPYNLELEIIRPDGSIRWVNEFGGVMRDGSGKVIGFHGTLQDITERKRAEEALRESEEKYRAIFEQGADSIVIIEEEPMRIVDFNDKAHENLGYSREEFVKLELDKINATRSAEKVRQNIEEIHKKGILVFEEKQLTKSGEIRDVLISSKSLNIGGHWFQMGIWHDITEQKRSGEALRESEERFSKAFRASPGGITISRLSDGTFLEVNESFLRIFGYTREEIIGHSSLELGIWLKPGDREKMLKLLKERGKVTNEEYSFRTKSGEIRTMLFSAELINIGHEPCLLAVTNDITDFRKIEAQAHETEKLKELDRFRTELLANISHELRTPLASIKGFATMLLDYEKRLARPEKREYLETIDKNADRLVELIEQLLEMSRLEAGMLSINKKPTNIIRLCREAIAEVRIRSSTHQFTLDIPARLPGINVDGRRIRQVLDNIIDNSVKFSDAGTEVNLAVRRKGPELLFTVTDHGIGIPKSDLPRVFNRMFHSPKKPEAAGAGLGLSICKGLVEAHGGRIWMESDEGKGTRCFFTLPLTPD